ncbi:IS110 family RNA-guided transposase [Rhizobium mongolense]|uniref:IS110 family transposase n=1 Tax=Rhizobium mongolense TaxID=57676 RepID=UPI000B8511F5|nr:IS110 family transposase [Rhizobium mongolense]
MDLATNVFQVHGLDADGKKLFNKRLRRSEVQPFLQQLSPCTVAMEAGGSAHYWAREIEALGHRAIILPGQYVKPFVKRDKTDAADAEAIAVAARQEGMRLVPVKTADQQALTALIKTRALFIRQRTKAFNAIRSHLAEFGLIVGTGTVRLEALARSLDGDQTGRVACSREWMR